MNKRQLIIILATILIWGTVASYLDYNFNDKSTREDILFRTKLIAAAINSNRVLALEASERDLQNPDYQRLKEQLTLIRTVDPSIRFLYLLGEKPTKELFFFVDSEPSDSKDYSPPGQIYNEAPDVYKNIFKTKKADVVGPAKDRWGTWISSCVPIYNFKTGKLIAVLGSDFNAKSWEINILKKTIPTIMITGFLFILTILFHFYKIAKKKAAKEKAHMQTQLFHSEKLASIGTMAAGVAHEINNPLAVISVYAELMETKCKDLCKHGTPAIIQNIRNAVARITIIVNGLMTYARQDTETIDNVDVHLCIKETLSLLNDLYKKKNIEIKTDLKACDGLIKANMGKMQQVLMNIIGNAKDALTDNQKGVIGIVTKDLNNSLLLEISDNGSGIPKDILPQIFDPFFTTKDPGKGTGLGLSICHTIIESFGGTITVKSEQSVGTTFSIIIPKNLNRSITTNNFQQSF